MFNEEEYCNEMNDLHASEALINGTLEKMKAEQKKLQEQQSVNLPDDATGNITEFPSPQVKKSLFTRRVLPIAACLLLALLGVLVFPHLTEGGDQENSQSYEFQLVKANTSLTDGLQFGSIGQQLDGSESGLNYAEPSKELLPEGILEGAPFVFGNHSVYLGFDEEKSVYYAAYLKEDSGQSWVLLRSDNLDEAAFIEALKTYLTQ